MEWSMEGNSTQSDVIVISSDDDDDNNDGGYISINKADGDDVIMISDDDEDQFEVASEKSNFSEDDIDDFNLNINLVVLPEKNDKSMKENVNHAVKHSFPIGIKGEQDEPPSKILRVKNEKMFHNESNTPFDDTSMLLGQWDSASCLPEYLSREQVCTSSVDAVRRQMSSSLLIGGIEGPRHPCSTDRGMCQRRHAEEEKAEPTKLLTDTLFTTMIETMDTLDKYTFHVFPLRAIFHAVNKNQFLSPMLLNTLMQYLIGSKEKEEVPGLRELYFGASILNKQLKLHPSCKPGMRHYYLKFCQVWFNTLLSDIDGALNEEPPLKEESLMSHPKHLPKSKICIDHALSESDPFDISDVVRRKRLCRRNMFKMLTKDEKIQRLSILLKFFTELLRSNTMVWFCKSWSEKCGILRSDICPLLAKLVWENNMANFGAPNSKLRELFRLYCSSMKENALHKDLGVIISLVGAILHRRERSCFPEMEDMTRKFAQELYFEIKKNSSCILANTTGLSPDWLRFHVLAFLLDVEEPANFFKMKEKVSRILTAKDRGQLLEEPELKEALCVLAVRSMMSMLRLKSSAPDNPTSDMLDEEHVWFKSLLVDERIRKMLKNLKSLLSLPCLKGRTLYLDGFEKIVENI